MFVNCNAGGSSNRPGPRQLSSQQKRRRPPRRQSNDLVRSCLGPAHRPGPAGLPQIVPTDIPQVGRVAAVRIGMSRPSPLPFSRPSDKAESWKSAANEFRAIGTLAEAWRQARNGTASQDNRNRLERCEIDHNGTMEYCKCAVASYDMTDCIHLDGVFRQIVEAVPNAMIVVNGNGQVVMMNAQGERVFGYRGNEILGWPIEQLVTERFRDRHPALRSAFLVSPSSGPMAPGRDLYALHKDGREILAEISRTPIETSDGPMVLLAIVDISERGQEEARIRAALKEKDILLGEIHHRVKNNLQIVSSLLDLQAARVADQGTQALLRDSQNRIHSMALIHQTLYGSKDFDSVDFAQFSETLLSALISSYGIDPDRIAIRVDVEPVHLPIDIAVPCGLVVNELITNALKHAFPNRDQGEIRIALTRQLGNEALLSVSDNGIGLPDHVDTRGTATIGLQLVGLLASQLDGEVSIHRSNPTRFSLRFPI